MVNKLIVLLASTITFIRCDELNMMPNIQAGNKTSYTVIMNSQQNMPEQQEQEIDMEEDTELDSEMILRDLDMSLYEYEQEILDDITQEFEKLRDDRQNPEDMPRQAEQVQ